MGMIAELAKIPALPGKRPEMMAALQAMVDQAATEPGTLVYVMHEDLDDENVVWTYELYTDQAARDAHGASPAMAAIGPALGALIGGAPQLIRLSPEMATGIEIS
jgi:quinol monooxygenase YgiN